VLAVTVAPASWVAISYLLSYAVLRLVMAWAVGVWGVGDDVLRKKIWLLPIRDALYFLVWLASFGSNRIRWGCDEYLVHNGQMVPVLASKAEAENPTAPAPR
jgi:hypothetical protein